MSKTVILKSIEDHVDTINISVNTLIQCCQQPEHLTEKNVKILYEVVDKHLLGIEADCKKFEQKIKDWKNPSFMSKAKNVFKDQAKLENSRKVATEKFQEVKTTVHELEEKYRSFQNIVEIYGIKV